MLENTLAQGYISPHLLITMLGSTMRDVTLATDQANGRSVVQTSRREMSSALPAYEHARHLKDVANFLK